MVTIRQVADLAEEQGEEKVLSQVCAPPLMALRQVTDLAQEQEK